jgi:transposase
MARSDPTSTGRGAFRIEGTGSFGAGLTRFLHRHGQVVVDVNRPDRAARRRRGKSDPLDAEAAAMLGLRTQARRYQALSAELTTLDTELDRLTRMAAPKLLALFGVGSDSAGALLVAAGDNLIGCAPMRPSRCCAGPHRSRLPRARPAATAQSGW